MHAMAKAAGELWDRVIALAESVRNDQWNLPTPCSEWDVADMLAHLGAIQTTLDGAPQPPLPEGWQPPDGNPVDAWTAAGVAARRGWAPSQIIAELRVARDSQVSRLEAADPEAPAQGPIGPTTEEGLFRIRCFDIWVHLQDLAEALNRPLSLDDESDGAKAAHEHVFRLVPWTFAKRVGAGEGDAAHFTLGPPLSIDQTLKVIEGRARWVADAESANTVSGAAAALTLLAAGRGTPERWRERGVLDWSGPMGEAFVARARLFT